jgi:uncharacterized protein (TIGR02231 family)
MAHLQTGITSVVVYPDRARVTRSGSMSLEAGSHKVEIRDLPLSLNPDSLRASARGTARARLMGLQVQREFYTQTPAENIRSLEEQLENLQDDVKRLDAKSDLMRRSRDDLLRLSSQAETFALALAAGEASVEDQAAMFTSLRIQAEKLVADLLVLDIEKRERERDIQKLKNELDQYRSARPTQRNRVIAEIEVSQAGELNLDMLYVVSGAGWKPLYDVRLLEREEEATVEVGYLAQVVQKSGEQWESVTLTLSTARPALASRLPELDPWFIDQERPIPVPSQPRMAVHAARMMDTASESEAIREGPLEMSEMEAASASVESSGAAVTYHLPGKAHIPGDGAPHKVTIAQFNLPPRLDYISAPKIAEAAYRRAKIPNDTQYLFLSGQANLFVGDEFIGSASIDLTPPKGEMELHLGVDDRIKVERKLKQREVDKRFIGGKRRTQFSYEITIENLLQKTADLTLQDQLPVSRHEDIKVKLETAEPKPDQHSRLNLLEWNLVLEPGEKKKVRFNFGVEHPQTLGVIGLP